MLTRFSVENFKPFRNKVVFELGKYGDYDFNTNIVYPDENVITKAIIYGFNGSGKTSLGLAIFDLILHLTDKEKGLDGYELYLNLDGEEGKPATFEYDFRFGNSTLNYKYQKTGINDLLNESLSINGKKVLSYDFTRHSGFVGLDGAETLQIAAADNMISRVKYVYSNAILKENEENQAFKAFMKFVDSMLMFYSLESNRYRGFRSGSETITTAIINAGKLREFEDFLEESEIHMHLVEGTLNGQKTILVKYQNALVDFYKVASTGTKSLALFYYWNISLDKASFVFMDEFDAFYHFELAEKIVKTLKKLTGTQIIFTTHNTDLLSNDLLRPDCYYFLNDCRITAIDKLTEKELRKAHNLQRMFKAGAFT